MTQVLDQPLLDTPLVDGILNDKPSKVSGLDSPYTDVATINTLIYDTPEPVQPEALTVIEPIV
jgi:hypothetical protein